MKTPYYFMISVIVIIGAGTDTSFGQYPEHMPHAMISLYTDKQNYGYSDTVTILGDVDKNDFKSLSWLDIEIRDPSGIIFKNDVIQVNSTGHYAYKLKISQNFTSGQYLIRVSKPYYHEVDLENSFYVNMGNQVMAKNDLGDGNVFNMQASDFGLPGDTIEINGNLVTKDSIKILLHDPDGITRYSTTTFADRNGEFASQLKVPSDAVSGLWKIVGNSGVYHRELNFTVSGYSSLQTCYGFHCTQSNSTGIITTWPNMHGNNPSMLQSPLKQFKSGVAANDVVCRPDMQLLIENQERFPICVKLSSVSNLLYRNWSYPTNCKYVHDPFTAGVAGLVMIEKNASDPSTGKSYSPRNSTVVIGWNNTVSWINQDVAPSSVTSDWNIFDSGSIMPGADWTHSFECVGNYGYHSEPHPWMKGWIRVLPPSR